MLAKHSTLWSAVGCGLILLAAGGRSISAQAQPSAKTSGSGDFAAVAYSKPSNSGDETGRATSTVSRLQMEERLPRSAPDALRYEPGVSIQQTAHGQASPYVRGLTGQQLVFMFDGVRLNNGLYRQGPNQYFFTVDANTLDHIDVMRGSASTVFGTDALGGAIIALPRQYLPDANQKLALHPRLFGRFATADREYGGRAELGAQLGPKIGILAGAGGRRVGLLRSGGLVTNPGYPVPMVPRFESDGKTQLGTGFDEVAADGRVVYQVRPRLQAIAAAYSYLQSNAPRTDQCPPPEAPQEECLVFKQQYRTLAYAALRGDAGKWARDFDMVLSYQWQHEWRQRDRPRSGVALDWRDDVHSLGMAIRATTQPFHFGRQGIANWRLRYGIDGYHDGVTSSATQSFTDINRSFQLSRGQYLNHSSYLTLGSFAEAEINPRPWVTVRFGGRAGVVAVRAPSDPNSSTTAVNKQLPALVGRAGIEVRPWQSVAFLFNVDQGFRAPNLDDLTSRQQTGPGFQFENPNLRPEKSVTFELGSRGRWSFLGLDAWGFTTLIEDPIVRVLRGPDGCPPETPQCQASRTQVQLVNNAGRARIFGTEGGATFYLPAEITVRSTLAYAWGDSPDLGLIETVAGPRVPLSRIPPLNGTVEARWRHLRTGIYTGAALRWAAAQRRLAPADLADARIPRGGTPGYAVFDLRAGWRYAWNGYFVRTSLVFENVLDSAYRVHGSSINGPGRGLNLAFDAGF